MREHTQTNANRKLRKDPPLVPYACRLCSDGTCPRCLDNQKWESRFNAKYGEAMKFYYGVQNTPMGVVNTW